MVKNIPVRYLSENKSCTVKKFKKDFNSNFSVSTLYKNIPSQYKKAQQESDLCEHCKLYPSLLNQKSKLTTQIQLTNNQEDKQKIQQQLEQINEQITFIEFHKQ